MDQFVTSIVQAVGVAYYANPKRRAYLLRDRVFHRRPQGFRINKCRVIGVMDADHFEVQVYQLQQQYAHTKGKPTVVADPGGLVVSVSPEAKRLGVRRLTKVDEARHICRMENIELEVIQKKMRFLNPEVKTKAYTFRLRDALMKAIEELAEILGLEVGKGKEIQVCLEGSDEFFVDLTHIVTKIILKARNQWPKDPRRPQPQDAHHGYWSDAPSKDIFLENEGDCITGFEFYKTIGKIAKTRYGPYTAELRVSVGAIVIAKLCEILLDKTDIVCSGGVGTTDTLSKLACKQNKPNSVTALTKKGFYRLSPTIDISDVPGFGGKLGENLTRILRESKLDGLQRHLNDPYKRRHVFPMLEDDHSKDHDFIFRLAHGHTYRPRPHKMMTTNVNAGKRRLYIEDMPEFKKELNIRCQDAIAKLVNEFKYNKRYPQRITFDYTTTGFRKRNFSVPPPDFWKAERLSETLTEIKAFHIFLKEFKNGVFQVVVNEREEELKEDLRRKIRSMNFRSFQFEDRGPLCSMSVSCLFVNDQDKDQEMNEVVYETMERPIHPTSRSLRFNEVSDEESSVQAMDTHSVQSHPFEDEMDDSFSDEDEDYVSDDDRMTFKSWLLSF